MRLTKNASVLRGVVFVFIIALSPTGLEVLSLVDAPKLVRALFIILAALVEIAIAQKPVRNRLSRLSIDREGPLGVVSIVLPGNRPPDGQLKRDRRAVLEALRDQLGQEGQQESNDQPPLSLELFPLPAAVEPTERGRAGQEPEVIPSKSIRDVYTGSRKQLLILGQAGAGKSTVVRELCRELVIQAEGDPTERFPVLLDLSGWAGDHQLLGDWMAEELHRKFKISPVVTRSWIQSEEIIALIDGLDEVREECRKACVDAINEFHGINGQIPIVVSCRTADYENLPRLALRAAVEVQALTPGQVDGYLAQLGTRAVGLRATVQADQQLQEMMANPLFLSIASRTYQGQSGKLAPGSTVEERRVQVLADYAAARLREWKSPPIEDRVVPWLEWLALYMKKHENTFRLDWLQPDALGSTSQRTALFVAAATVWLLIGALLGVAFALICDVLAIAVVAFGLPHLPPLAIPLPAGGHLYIELPYDIGPAIVLAAVLGAAAGLVVGWLSSTGEIEPLQPISKVQLKNLRFLPIWGVALGILGAATLGSLGAILSAWVNPDLGRLVNSSVNTRNLTLVTAELDALICALIFGTAMLLWIPRLTFSLGYLGLVYGAVIGYTNGWGGGFGPWILAGGMGWAAGILVGLTGALQPQAFQKPMSPGEAINVSKRNAVIGGIVGFLIGGVTTGPLLMLFQPQTRQFGPHNIYTALYFTALFGLLSGLIIAQQLGGGTYFRHRLLLWQLTRQGVVPRDYLGSLQEAARVVILRRRGGGYQFLHRLLLEYFENHRTRSGSLQNVSAGRSGTIAQEEPGLAEEIGARIRR